MVELNTTYFIKTYMTMDLLYKKLSNIYICLHIDAIEVYDK